MKKLLLFILLSLYLFGENYTIAGASQLKEKLPIITQKVFYDKLKKDFDKGSTYRKNKSILVKELDKNFYLILDENKEYKASKKYTNSNYKYTGHNKGDYKIFTSNQFYKEIKITKENLEKYELPLKFYLQEGWEGFAKVEAGCIIFMREKPFTLFQVKDSDLKKKFIKVK